MPDNENEGNFPSSEIFLLIRSNKNDVGVRPLSNEFVSDQISITNNILKANVTNLGTRAAYAAFAELYAFPIGKLIDKNSKISIGRKNLQTINMGETKTIDFTLPNNIGDYRGDVFMIQIYHPILDPLTNPCDPINDRHVGQCFYPFSGIWIGTSGNEEYKFSIKNSSLNTYEVGLYIRDGISWREIGIWNNLIFSGRTKKLSKIEIKPKKPILTKHNFKMFQTWTINMINNNTIESNVLFQIPKRNDERFITFIREE